MAKWGVQDVLKEPEDIDDMARLRPASTVVQQPVSSLKQKIQGMGGLTASTLVLITSALDNTVLSARVKEEISELLEQQVAGQGQSALKLQIQPQALNAVWNYVSASEWKQLKSCNNTNAVQILVRRLKACGLKSLKESTKKSGVALVVHLALQRGEAKPPAQEIYKLSMYFADSFHACTQEALFGGLATYPHKPADIGDHFVKAFYQPEDGPAQVDAQVACGVTSLMKSIKLRSSSSEINAPQSKAPRQEEKPSWSPGKVMAQCMDMTQTMMVRARNLDVAEPVHLLKRGVAQTSTKALEAPGPENPSSSCTTLALPCLPAPAESQEERKEENTEAVLEKKSGQKTLEQFEAEALEQLEVRAAAAKDAKDSKKRKDSLKRSAASKVPKKEPLQSRTTGIPSKTKEQSKKAEVGKSKKGPGEYRPYNPDSLDCYGCSRCRWDPFGCSACAKKDFQGRRLNGRAAWQKWWEKEKKRRKAKIYKDHVDACLGTCLAEQKVSATESCNAGRGKKRFVNWCVSSFQFQPYEAHWVTTFFV